ncbi:ORF6N domain-containing protein [Sulfuritalea sp.]|uniref:ORF6N domain-containing protein n=1 Tax=Sulfuritalea sp. TaxID=2480090 RepID=UPI003919D0E6
MAVEAITSRIVILRGQRVIVDADLAALYGVPTKRLDEQVRRNAERFPADFMFALSQEEWDALRSQFATLKTGTRPAPQVRDGRHIHRFHGSSHW